MNVKFNKDALLKNRFWILVSASACLTLAGIFYLELYGSTDTNKARKDLKATSAKGKSAKGTTSQAVIDLLAVEAEKAGKKAAIVWKSAYEEQEPLLRWAPKVEADFDFLKGKFAHDIKIAKLADEKSWPDDKEFTIHGKFIDIQPNYFKIKARKGKEIKVYRMENLAITDTDASKPIEWGTQFRQHIGKLLTINFQNGKYFGDKLLEGEQDVFEETYNAQIRDILKTVNPVDENGNGVVLLRNWPYRADSLPDEKDKDVRFIRFVQEKWDVKNKFSKEAWIAEENIWIQKEIYEIIKRTNDEISKFVGQGGEQKEKVYNFKNANFALELFLKNDSTLNFKITNLLPRRQKLDLNFRVQMNKQGAAPIFRISGLPLDPFKSYAQTIPPPKETGNEPARTGVYGVEQMLTWETAAVKRIDHISIGSIAPDDISYSHRNFAFGLMPFDKNDLPKEGKEEKKQGFGMNGGGFGVGKGRPGGDKGGGAGGNKTALRYGLWTDRYFDVSEQSRRIPVAVSLIVDQDHVDRVMTQFNNSKLRFLESQVLLNHYTASLQPPTAEATKENGNKSEGPFGLQGGVRDGPAPSAGGQDLETNMEMVIYGIMTLYQRYPPRPGEEKKQ